MNVDRGILALTLALAACARPSAPEPTASPAPPPVTATPAAEPDPEIEALNLDFERAQGEQPEGWRLNGEGYTLKLDDDARSGQASLAMTFDESKPDAFAVAVSTFPLDRARGKRVTLRGSIKTEEVREGFAGLWIRVDGEGGTVLGFDNMGDRGITGTTPWQEVELVVDVPPEAVGVMFGALLTGQGAAWVDALSFELGPIPVLPSEVAVTGTVTGPGDAPVAGASVALLPAGYGGSLATQQTGADGAFTFRVPPGTYRLSASAPGLRARATPPRTYEGKDEPTRVALEAGGVTVRGQVRDERGEPLGGADVWVKVPDFMEPPFYTRAADDGHYIIDVKPDTELTLVVNGKQAYSDHQQIRSDRPLTVDLSAVRRLPVPDEVVDDLRERVIALDGVTAGAGLDDMEPLRKVVGKARVVGLGEATHGTREFFQMKHRMLEFLVERMGFTVFAIEATFTGTMVVNDYVLHGKGSAEEGLDAMQFWTWHTEEVRDLIEWMRAYNVDPAHTKKLEFLGIDMQGEEDAAGVVAAYLHEVDPEYTGVQAALDASPDAVIRRLDEHRKDYVARSSVERWQLARQHAVVYRQWKQQEADSPTEGFNHRDRSMAANLRWILDTRPRGTKVVLWAHNGHVGREFMAFQPMGSLLSKALGSDYRIFGFAFGDGGFQAIGSDGKGLQAWEVGEPPPESFDAALRRAGCSVCVLDLRRLPRRGALRKWLARPRISRSIGALYSTAKDMEEGVRWLDLYDAVIYVDRTTRARPVPPAR